MQHYTDDSGTRLQRVRLSAWARQEGIARITAYRMLKRGILPVPAEQSPTGRWFVLVPQQERHPAGRLAFYARVAPGTGAGALLNRQIEALAVWASSQRRTAFVVVREVANPFTDSMRKLQQLLVDTRIRDIVIESVDVLGQTRYELLVAALAGQDRGFIVTDTRNAGAWGARQRRACGHPWPVPATPRLQARRGSGTSCSRVRRFFGIK